MINPVGRLALNESLAALGQREVNVDQAVYEQLGRPLGVVEVLAPLCSPMA